jgi:hypothetical protein
LEKARSRRGRQIRNFAAQFSARLPLLSVFLCRNYLGRILAGELEKNRNGGPAFSVDSTLALRALGARSRFRLNPLAIGACLPPYCRVGRETARLYDYFLASGDLKSRREDIRNNVIYREMAELCEYGADFRLMPLYADFVGHLAEGRPLTRYRVPLDSKLKIDEYFMMYLDLADSIKRRGLRSREEFVKSEKALDRWLAPKGLRSNKTEWFERDIGLAVLEDGSLAFNGCGQHRRALAMVLGLGSMPVEVQMIHKDWLAGVWKKSGRPTALEALEEALEKLRARVEAGLYFCSSEEA